MSHARDNARLARTGIPTVEAAQGLRDLTAFSQDEPTAVQTLGALTAGDGGGGLWRWDATAEDTDNLGTVLLPTDRTDPGRWIRVWDTDVNVAWFGVYDDGATDNTAAIQAAIDYWVTISAPYAPTNGSSWTGPSVVFPGGKYKVNGTVTVSPRASIRGTGNCVLLGNGTNVGLDCSAKLGFISHMGFENFSVAIQFITQNVASARWSFKDIEIWGCATGISSVSYALSRSTVVSIDGLRFAETTTALELYCDKQEIRDVNGRTTSPQTISPYFILDGLVEITNLMIIPLAAAIDGSRWINFGGTSTGNAARGLTINNSRFSAENSGGMPVVYNYEPGNDATRTGSFITFHNSQLSVDHGGSGNVGGAVVLAEVNGVCQFPGFIGFSQCSLFASADEVQLVRLESALPLNTAQSAYRIIDADEVTLRNCSRGNPETYPLVDDALKPYLRGNIRSYYTNRAENCTVTDYPGGSIEFDIMLGKTKESSVDTGSELTTILNPYEGDSVVIIAKNANLTVKHLAPNIYLYGAADAAIPAGGVLALTWIASWGGGRWCESSRTF